MTRLIKNELFKIFHKKIIYILMIICVFMTTALAILQNITFDFDFPIAEVKEEDYNLKNTEELDYFISDKTEYDIYQIIKEKGYKYDSPEYYYVEHMLRGKILDKYYAQYQNKNNYAEVKAEYDKAYEFLDHFDAMKIVKDERDSYVINEVDKEHDLYDIKVLDYRIKHNIPYSSKSEELDSLSYYYDNYKEALDILNNKKNIKNNELVSLRERIATFKTLDYQLDHDLYHEKDSNYDTTKDAYLSIMKSITFMELFVIIVFSSTIINEEFNKGTIKQLLVKPYTRTKILFSKIITVCIIILLFQLWQIIVDCTASLIVNGGIDTSSVLVYDFNINSVKEVNVILYGLINFVCLLPKYLILMLITILCSLLINSNALAITVGYGVNVFASLATIMNLKMVGGLLFTNCWNFQEFLYGGISSIPYVTFTKSFIISLLLIVILLVSSLLIFNKKDIKNI